MVGTCIACNKYGELDQCHIRSKAAGGTSESHNILMMCRVDHTYQHSKGWRELLKKYPNVEKVIKSRGWELWSEGNRFYMYHEKND